MTADPGIFALNAGEISRFALARVDLAKLRVACEQQLNILPHVLGPAMLRPGTAYVAEVPGDDEGWLGEFYYSENEKALIVLTGTGMYFLVNGAFVTRPSVSAVIANGDFTTDLTGWIDSDESGTTSNWTTGGFMALTGTGTNYAQRDQEITVTETGVEHGVRFVIERNTVRAQIGSAQGESDYFDAELAPGIYSIAITPNANFWIRLGARSPYPALVDGVGIDPAGPLSFPTPYIAKAHFDAIRYDQSGDVLFVACAGFQQRRIERRTSDSRSWGFALYQADDGPFRLSNVSSTTIAPSGTVGAITLTASRSLFYPGHEGALYRVTHTSQRKTATLAAVSDATGEIRVSGLTSHNSTSTSPGNASTRGFAYTIEGTFVATIELQRSLAEPGAWTMVKSFTAPASENYDDGLDNQIIYYRLACTAYTSGAADAVIAYSGAAQNGIVRITAVSDSLSASADVLVQLGDTEATSDWAEGEWSDYRGWPSAAALHDGRLCWFPSIKAQLSVSDAFASFDDTVEGDSGPINRTIATGGADGVRWALSLQRLIAATATQEVSIRASAFDEPLSPTAFTARVCSTRGAAGRRPVKVGTVGIFVERNGSRVFELAYDINTQDYHSKELTRLKQEMCAAGVADIAVQMQPDTRIWLPLGDGTCAVLTYDQDDDVVAWTSVDTDGAIERVAVLPGNDEDDVYFLVRRTIGGVTKRFIEKLAKQTECRGATLNKSGLDSHVVYSGAATTTVSAPHLAGKTVGVWADGKAAGTVTLDGSGTGTLAAAATNYVAGLPVRGRIKTAKLAFNTEHGTGLTLKKRISRLGLVMADVSWQGVRIGRDFDHMTGLPTTYRSKVLTAGQVIPAYDAMVSFNGGWDEDVRVCIEVSGPHCCMILGLVPHMETNAPTEPALASGDR